MPQVRTPFLGANLGLLSSRAVLQRSGRGGWPGQRRKQYISVGCPIQGRAAALSGRVAQPASHVLK